MQFSVTVSIDAPEGATQEDLEDFMQAMSRAVVASGAVTAGQLVGLAATAPGFATARKAVRVR